MTLQDLGSIGELIGAVATVATLAYLAVQIRLNTAQNRESSRALIVNATDQMLQSFSRYRHLMAQPGIAEVYTRGLDSYLDLPIADQIRFRCAIEEHFTAYLALYSQTRRQAHDDLTSLDEERTLPFAQVFASRGGREWWSERRDIWPDWFVEIIERRYPDAAQ